MSDKKNVVLVILLVLLISMGTPACSTFVNNDAAILVSESTEGKIAGNGKNHKGTIEFFQSKREAVDTFDELIIDFNAKYPNIAVKQNNVSNNAGKVAKARAASGDFPDIYLSWPTDNEFKNYVNNGLIMNVTNEGFTRNSIPEIQKLYEYNGKMYGVPLSMNAAGVIYNKKLFKEAGVEVPKTWSEFVKVCDKLKSKNIIPIELTIKDGWTVGTFNQLIMHELFTYEMFQKVIKGETPLTGSKEWRELSEKTLKITEYSQRDAIVVGYDQGIQEFANGKAAMFLQGLWAIPSIKKVNSDIKLGTFAFPGVDNVNKIKVTSGVDVGLSISAQTKNPEACKAFLDFLTTREIAQKYSDMDMSFSAIKGVKINDPAAEGLQEAFDNGKVSNWLIHFWPIGAGDVYTELVQEFIINKDYTTFAKEMDKMFKDIQK